MEQLSMPEETPPAAVDQEELQSVNEELTALNQELRYKVEEVSQANNDLQNLIAAMHIAALFLNRQLRITRYLPGVQGIFNLIPTDLNRPLDHVTHTLRDDRLTADAQQVLTTLAPVSREVERTTGEWYLLRMLPYRTGDERIDGVVLTFVDITERKRAEAALRQSEERYRSLIEASSAVVWTTAADGSIIEALPAWQRFTGLSFEAYKHFGYANAFHPDDRAATMEVWQRAIAERKTLETEFRLRYHDGGYRRVIARGVPLFDARGDVQAWVGTVTDIQEKHEAAEALRRSEERFRAVADLVPDLLWSNAPRGGTDWYNQRWLEYTGQTLAEAQGYGWLDVIHPDDREKSGRAFQNAVDAGEPLRQEYRIRRTDGAYRWFLARARPVRDAAGRITCWYGTATDIHEERTALAAEQVARAEAEAALEVRNQFLSIASHELRTPLTPLLGYAGMLRQSMAQTADVRQRRLVETIERQANRLNTLIGTLLDVARLQRGQFTLEARPLDLAALTARVVDDFRLTLPGEGACHTITLLGPDAALPVVGDASRLEEVLHNLLSNAVKYSPGGGMVRVRVGRQDGEAVLEVADEGIGIPAEAQARLVEPFYRAENVGPRTSGFGLGLYIVGEIVQRHGGRVEVTSTEGQGTALRVVLPLHERER